MTKHDDNVFEKNTCIIKVDVNSKKEENANYFQYHSYVILETVKESIIQQIDRLEFFNDTIFILDSKQGSVFVFDSKGKFISKIYAKGGSPKEYLSLSDFFIDNSNHIYLYDGVQGLILVYDIGNSFIEKINLQKGFSFTRLSDSNWLFYLGNGFAMHGEDIYHNILIYNENFELIRKELPFNKHMLGLKHTVASVNSTISIYNDTTYILPFLSNYIYSYSSMNSTILPVYKIEFINRHNKGITKNMNQLDVKDYLTKINQGVIPSRINNFYKINNTVFFMFAYENKKWLCLYKEAEQVSVLCDCAFDENGLFFNPINYFSNKKDEKIISIVDGGKFEISKNLDKKNNVVLHEISESIDDTIDTNPILVFYTLK